MNDYIFIRCYKSTVIQFNQVKLVFLFIINKNVNFECISIAKHIINLFNDKLKVKYIRQLVRKSYTPVVPIANTCNADYRHDPRADNDAYRHDRRADSLNRALKLMVILCNFCEKCQSAGQNQQNFIMCSRKLHSVRQMSGKIYNIIIHVFDLKALTCEVSFCLA